MIIGGTSFGNSFVKACKYAKKVVTTLPKKLGLTQDIFTASKQAVKKSAPTVKKESPIVKKGVSTIKQGVQSIKKKVTKMSEDFGKEVSKISETAPRSVIQPDEAAGMKCFKIAFFPEDGKKLLELQNTSWEKYEKFRAELINKGRYKKLYE